MKDKKNLAILILAAVCLLLLGAITGYALGNREPPPAAAESTPTAEAEPDANAEPEAAEETAEPEEKPVTYTVTTESTPLGIREKADIKAAVTAYVPKGANITVTKTKGHWGYTDYHSAAGWVNLDYCTEGENYAEGLYYVATERDPLSLREEPNRNAEIVTRIPRGAEIYLSEIDSSGMWGFAAWDHYSGWVSLRYVTYGALPAGWAAGEAAAEEETVFVLISEYAEVYHKYRNCDGLENADPSHELREVTRSEAEAMGRRPCKVCY